MRSDLVRWLVFCGACTVAAAAARAETFVLEDGCQIQGELVNAEESPRQQYVIKTPSGGTVTLSTRQVTKVVHQTAAENEYARIRPSYPDTVEAQWALAEWCQENHLASEREKHLERVIELDPEHAEARRLLGYSKRQGRWVTQEQFNEQRGLRRYKGAWRTQQEIESMERNRQIELAEKQWFAKLKLWRDWLEDDRAEKAAENIGEIDDPNAVRALTHYFEKEPHDEIRILYIKALARIKSPAALEFLTRVSLKDENEEVRLTAIDYLVLDKRPEVIKIYTAALRSKDNDIINRAAVALAHMKDPDAIVPLIDALETVHKYTLTQGKPGGVSTTFGTGSNSGVGGFPSAGGGGLSVGQQTKVVKRTIRNQEVLDALISLTRVNYQFDVKGWKAWVMTQKKAPRLDVRRD